MAACGKAERPRTGGGVAGVARLGLRPGLVLWRLRERDLGLRDLGDRRWGRRRRRGLWRRRVGDGLGDGSLGGGEGRPQALAQGWMATEEDADGRDDLLGLSAAEAGAEGVIARGARDLPRVVGRVEKGRDVDALVVEEEDVLGRDRHRRAAVDGLGVPLEDARDGVLLGAVHLAGDERRLLQSVDPRRADPSKAAQRLLGQHRQQHCALGRSLPRRVSP
mmetsp:Transcript_7049/g.15440  ORF Transcript_7049/g.15440 Transcript_7049/m.15440 type:complete len:220 (+) Transcript_7049:883-1542(+)